ncbi:MAG: hypothetical protein HYY04_13650 [Chloroflexi bacterium]|nr:hypothetical protein [Chloroflexota bacterium]
MTRSRRLVYGSLALVLWVATAAVGLAEILTVADILVRLATRLGVKGDSTSGAYTLITISRCAIVVFGVVWLAFVIASADYHYRRLGQRRSWKVFGWTIVVEATIAVVGLLM